MYKVEYDNNVYKVENDNNEYKVETGYNVYKAEYDNNVYKVETGYNEYKVENDFVCLFDLILYVPSTIFQLYIGTGLPGLNQY